MVSFAVLHFVSGHMCLWKDSIAPVNEPMPCYKIIPAVAAAASAAVVEAAVAGEFVAA